MSSLFGEKRVVGLDIGSNSIKMAELIVSKKSSSLVSFGVLPTPPQAYLSGDISDTQAIATAIREIMAKLKTKRKNIATGLGGTSVIVKRITIPKMDEKLMPQQIRYEAEQYIPYPMNDVNLAFEILRKSPVPSESMDVLLVAAIQSHVIKYIESVTLAGYNCSIMDVSGFALANCFKANYGDMEGQTVALLDVGAHATTMVVLENTEIVFCRDIPAGGMTYTMDLQKNLNISQEEAEAIKLNPGKSAPAEAQQIIQSTHELVTEEIRGGFDFFLNSARSGGITRCFVTGGGSKVKGFIESLSKITPSERMDPFFNVKVNPKVFSPQVIASYRDIAATAIGLGLRSVGDA